MEKKLKYFLFFILLLLAPIKAKALDKVKECIYSDNSNKATVTIYNDYTSLAKVEKVNGSSSLNIVSISNWDDYIDYVKASTNATCPNYIGLSNNKVYVSNNTSALSSLGSNAIALSSSKFVNNKTNLKEEIFSCSYSYNTSNGSSKDLVYHFFPNNVVGLPFKDKTLLDDNLAWYHSSNFSTDFIAETKVSNNTYTCPTITISLDSNFVTVYPNSLNSSLCKNCVSLPGTIKLSESAKNNAKKSISTVSSCQGNNVAIYGSSKYFYPYFRLLSDGAKEYSLDGKTYFNVTETVKFKVDNIENSIKVNSSLLSTIFSANEVNCPNNIYRCVNKNGNGYNYELSTVTDKCVSNNLGENDNQALGTKTNLGAPSTGTTTTNSNDLLSTYDQDQTCTSILGDGTTGDDNGSVAWLLQHVLNYIKILGPILVVVLSSLDFTRSIVQSDEENMKKARTKLINRLICAVLLFFIPTIVSLLLSIFGMTDNQTCGLK